MGSEWVPLQTSRTGRRRVGSVVGRVAPTGDERDPPHVVRAASVTFLSEPHRGATSRHDALPPSSASTGRARSRLFPEPALSPHPIAQPPRSPTDTPSMSHHNSRRSHPCNLYEFSIYGGMSPDVAYMQPLHHGSLKNDTVAEVVPLPTDVATQGRGSVVSTRVCAVGKGHFYELGSFGFNAGTQLFPVKYIRIDAYSAHTQNYNVSIW